MLKEFKEFAVKGNMIDMAVVTIETMGPIGVSHVAVITTNSSNTGTRALGIS